MDKHRSTLPGKTRTREHVIADLGLNCVERHVLLCGFTLQRIHSDYGYDYVMWTYNPQGRIESREESRQPSFGWKDRGL